MDRKHVETLFRFQHLPPHLADVSAGFHALAVTIAEIVPPSAERTLCLRELWAAKNLAVVAAGFVAEAQKP